MSCHLQVNKSCTRIYPELSQFEETKERKKEKEKENAEQD